MQHFFLSLVVSMSRVLKLIWQGCGAQTKTTGNSCTKLSLCHRKGKKNDMTNPSMALMPPLNSNNLSCFWKLMSVMCHEVLSSIKDMIGCLLIAIKTLKIWPCSQFLPSLSAQ